MGAGEYTVADFTRPPEANPIRLPAGPVDPAAWFRQLPSERGWSVGRARIFSARPARANHETELTVMDSEQAAPEQSPPEVKRRFVGRRVLQTLIAVLLIYLAVAYLVMPVDWRWYVHRHPSLDDIPDITLTGNGIPGDPLNVAVIGTEAELKQIVQAAGWHAGRSARAAERLDDRRRHGAQAARRYGAVSNLFLFGRKEDLAFEQPVGDSPRKRNHVRFWHTDKIDNGRPEWIGSATYDERVGLSGTTGQITHHIAADVDAERDHLFQDLKETGDLSETYFVDGFHKTLEGRNGGGDRWYTDGRLEVGGISATLP